MKLGFRRAALTQRNALFSCAAGGAQSAEIGRELYPNTFKPLKVAHVTLKNRILMGSMHTGLEEVGLFGGGQLDEMAAYFAERYFLPFYLRRAAPLLTCKTSSVPAARSVLWLLVGFPRTPQVC